MMIQWWMRWLCVGGFFLLLAGTLAVLGYFTVESLYMLLIIGLVYITLGGVAMSIHDRHMLRRWRPRLED